MFAMDGDEDVRSAGALMWTHVLCQHLNWKVAAVLCSVHLNRHSIYRIMYILYIVLHYGKRVYTSTRIRYYVFPDWNLIDASSHIRMRYIG